jgi:hypothetical protein
MIPFQFIPFLLNVLQESLGDLHLCIIKLANVLPKFDGGEE